MLAATILEASRLLSKTLRLSLPAFVTTTTNLSLTMEPFLETANASKLITLKPAKQLSLLKVAMVTCQFNFAILNSDLKNVRKLSTLAAVKLRTSVVFRLRAELAMVTSLLRKKLSKNIPTFFSARTMI